VKEFMTRPISVTVIAWVIIALSLQAIVPLFGGLAKALFTSGYLQNPPLTSGYLQNPPLSLNVMIWGAAASLVISIALAILILLGFGWARVVYICMLSVGLLGVIIGGQPLELAISIGAKIIIFSYFLFRHDSNEFFRGLSQHA